MSSTRSNIHAITGNMIKFSVYKHLVETTYKSHNNLYFNTMPNFPFDPFDDAGTYRA